MRKVILGQEDFAAISTGVLSRNGSFSFKARGSSMYPFIRDGDILTVEPVLASELDTGDVAFYRSAGENLAAHRFIGRTMINDRTMLILRGDASAGRDEHVMEDRILGKVAGIQRGTRIIQHERGLPRLAILLWTYVQPPAFTWPLKQAAAGLLRGVQSLKSYRILSGKLLGGKVGCRVAGEDDASDIYKLYGYSRFMDLEEHIRSFGLKVKNAEESEYTLVATLGEKIAGAVVIKRFPKNNLRHSGWWLFGLLVRARHRGSGIGDMLMSTALTKAAAGGADRINLMVSEDNRAALNLYRKWGFHRFSFPATDTPTEDEKGMGEHRNLVMSRCLDSAPEPNLRQFS
ncbi:MAG: GNAT family N-acetyltransferase [Nitrospirota bacterium]|nr:GNAT family N-acetyltransferase [Nitrospirota bacterium]